MNPEELREEERRLLDITRQTSFGFWNALLTLDGILISVFSVAAVLEAGNRLLVLALVICSVLSALLIVRNYKDAKHLYSGLGPLVCGDPGALAKDKLDKQYKAALKAHNDINCREKVTLFLLYGQLILIVLLLTWPWIKCCIDSVKKAS
jgi:hypothetical protein